jgi:NRPS condensation-like uncharacterized protein
MINNRKLGDSEQVMEILNRYGGSTNIVIISRIKGKIREDFLRQTLDLLQCIHPRLNSRIVGSLDALSFTNEEIRQIPLTLVVHTENKHWQDVALEELNKAIDSSKVLLRCILIYNKTEINTTYLITTIHHGIADGLSCIRLQSELLKYYKMIASGDSIDRAYSLPAIPSLDELLPQWMMGIAGVINGALFLFNLTLKMALYQPETLEHEKDAPLESRRCSMTHRFLEKEVTQKLVKLCHQENTTVHGALCAAILITVAERIRAGNTRKINTSCRSFLDLRRRLEPVVPHENMGSLASFLTSFHTLTPQLLFWDLARDVTQQIQCGLREKDFFKSLRMGRKIIEYYLDHPDDTSLTISVTNLGRLNIPEVYGDFELEEIIFVPSNVIFGRVFTAAVSTFKDKMTLNFLVSKPSISQETMEIIANGVINCLVEVCEEKVVRAVQ